MERQRTYYCIDMKSFYASVECAERGWNPFETNLVVADLTCGRNALCLAITPHMKTLGIKNRCRLSDIPKDVHYEVAPPRMALYIEYAADIYSMYLHSSSGPSSMFIPAVSCSIYARSVSKSVTLSLSVLSKRRPSIRSFHSSSVWLRRAAYDCSAR